MIEDYMTLSEDWYVEDCFWLPDDRVCIAWNEI